MNRINKARNIQTNLHNMKKSTSKTSAKLISNKGITLITLIITIIVMLILVAASVTVALEGGLIVKTREAAEETEKAEFLDVAQIAYTDLCLAKIKNETPGSVTLGELTAKLINDPVYGEQITQVTTGGITDITLTPESLTLKQGQSGTIAVTYGESESTSEAYIKIGNNYYKINLEGTKVTLGEKVKQVPTGNTDAKLTVENNNAKLTVVVENSSIKVTAAGDAPVGTVKVTAKYGTIAKEITVSIIKDPKETGELGKAVDASKYGSIAYNYKAKDYPNLVWQLLYKDSKNVYLIADTGEGEFSEYKDSLFQEFAGEFVGDARAEKYTSGSDISPQAKWLSPKASQLFSRDELSINMIETAYLSDTSDDGPWSGFLDANGKAVWAMGSPTVELLISSYNATQGTNLSVQVGQDGYILPDFRCYIYSICSKRFIQ